VVDPTTDDNHAIQHASSWRHHKIVQLLLKHEAGPTTNNNYYYAIRIASASGYFEVIRLLLNNGSKYKVDVKADNNFAIKHDSGLNKQTIIKLLEEYSICL